MWEEAVNAYGESIAILKRLVERDPSNTELIHKLSVSCRQYGRAKFYQGNPEDAVNAYAKSIGILGSLSTGHTTYIEW